MNCCSCGKEIRDAKEIARNIPQKDTVSIYIWIFETAHGMTEMKCVCRSCASVFCVPCGEREGEKRKSNDIHCPRCGERLMSKDEAQNKLIGNS